MESGTIVMLLCTLFSCALSASFPFNRGQQPSPGSDLPKCQQPPVAGLCLAFFQRYYYNATTGKCQDFVYGGCSGNLNNFITEEECLKACAGDENNAEVPKIQHETLENNEEVAAAVAKPIKEEEKDVCSLPEDSGLCYALIEKFFFDGKECKIFQYGGCGGNGNNFDSLEECNKACPKKTRK